VSKVTYNAIRKQKETTQKRNTSSNSQGANMKNAWNANALDVHLIKKCPIKNGNGKADAREGKDVAHRKALSKGGANKHGVNNSTFI
jgi:hypothetical protein